MSLIKRQEQSRIKESFPIQPQHSHWPGINSVIFPTRTTLTNSTPTQWRSYRRGPRNLTNKLEIELTPWLMEPGGSMPHSRGLSNNPFPELNQPNYPHLFMVHSNIVLPSTLRPPQRSLSCRFTC